MLYWIFVGAVVIQCAYALFFFVRIFISHKKQLLPPDQSEGVSIIICARNEAEHLRQNLPAVLTQKYVGKFEVIVVNDASTDDTGEVLEHLKLQFDNLREVIIREDEPRTLQGKKFALSRGVQSASYDWLLMTDADCIPATAQWLENMVAPLGQGKQIVAGYGRYKRHSGLLNAFIRWETMHTYLQYRTYALAGFPYMAVGRNMACTKEVMQKAQQLPLWNIVPSGDDDLLMRLAARGDNTAIVSKRIAYTYSEPKRTWKEWTAQKQRHLSTGKYYKAHIKFFLGLYGLSHAVMWVCYFIMLFVNWKVALAVCGLRCKVYWIIWSGMAGKIREKKLIYLFPVFDVGWMIYNFVFFPYIALKNKKTWR